jgi:hypothetical protein
MESENNVPADQSITSKIWSYGASNHSSAEDMLLEPEIQLEP